jgi:hypothetical protein
MVRLLLFRDHQWARVSKGGGRYRAPIQEVASVRYDRGLGAYTPCSEWQIKTQGSNINVLNMEGRRCTVTMSSASSARLGIRGCQALLLGEFTSTAATPYADHRHIAFADRLHGKHRAAQSDLAARCTPPVTWVRWPVLVRADRDELQHDRDVWRVDNVDGCLPISRPPDETAPAGKDAPLSCWTRISSSVIEGERSRAGAC